MKKFNIKQILCLVFFFPFFAYAQSASFAGEDALAPMKDSRSTMVKNDVVYITADKLEVVALSQPDYPLLSQELYAAYKNFKQKKINEVVTQLTQNGFENEVKKSLDIEPKGSVDSLIFKSVDSSKISFSMVDIGYLKNVTASIHIRTDNPEMLLLEFEKLLANDGLETKSDLCIPSICAEFEALGEYWVVDRRWKELTYTRYKSLYYHVMSKYDDYFVINFRETVPQEWVSADMVPKDRLGLGYEYPKNTLRSNSDTEFQFEASNSNEYAYQFVQTSQP